MEEEKKKGFSTLSKAARIENELANWLWEHGYAVVRSPASGAGLRHRFQPDLIAVGGGVALLIEIKLVKGPYFPIYIPSRQVYGLLEAKKKAGWHSAIIIAARYPNGIWKFYTIPEDAIQEVLEEVNPEMYRIKPSIRGLSFEELEEALNEYRKEVEMMCKRREKREEKKEERGKDGASS